MKKLINIKHPMELAVGWLVFSVGGRHAPTELHETASAAKDEAIRLARGYHHDTFLVAQVKGVYKYATDTPVIETTDSGVGIV